MNILSVFIIFCTLSVENWQSKPNVIELLTNGGEKYWDIKKGDFWRLDKKGLLSEYYYENKLRIETHYFDYVISYHRWTIKNDAIFEMAGARVIGEYQILKLTKDTMILRSLFGMNGKDTLFFQSSKDQLSSIRKNEKAIRIVE